MEAKGIGRWLDTTREKHAGTWKILFFVLLAGLVGVNLFLRPHHAEYGYDTIPGFWAAFGLLVAVLMVLVMKKIVQPLIERPEESDDDDA